MAIIDKMMVYGGIKRLNNKCTEHKAQNANNFLDKPLAFIKSMTCTHPENGSEPYQPTGRVYPLENEIPIW